MADTRYLKRRGQTWFFQMGVPRPLRAKLGKPVIVEALHTQSLAEAQRLRWARVEHWQGVWERTRTGAPLSLADIDKAASKAYHAMLNTMATIEAPASLIENVEKVYINFALGVRQSTRLNLPDCIESITDFKCVQGDMEAACKDVGVTLEPMTETYNLLGQALFRAHLAAFKDRLRAFEGKLPEKPVTFLGARGIDMLQAQPQAKAVAKVSRGHGITFSEASARFLADRQRDPAAAMSEGARLQYETVFRLFGQFVDDAPLDSIDRKTAAEFLETISHLDPHYGQHHGVKDIPLADLPRGTGLSNRTLNKYAMMLSAVFKWADRTGRYEGRNPFAGQGGRKVEVQGWLPFTLDELNRLFADPPETIKWISLIGLYSGMRLNEICTAELGHEAGIPFFNVREGKTAAATRRVPVHSALRLDRMPDFGLKPGGPDNKPSWNFVSQFTKYRRSVGVNRPNVSFHSFRKTFVTALDNAGVPQHDIAAVVGHARGFTLDTYSGGKGLAKLRDIVEKVSWPGLVTGQPAKVVPLLAGVG
jgi:integrase